MKYLASFLVNFVNAIVICQTIPNYLYDEFDTHTILEEIISDELSCPNKIDSLKVWRIESGRGQFLRERQIIRYASNGEVSFNEHYFNWDAVNLQWGSVSKMETEFYNSGNWKSLTNSRYKNNWYYDSRRYYEYDSYGRRTLEERFDYDTIKKEWQLNSREKHINFYDSVGNLIESQCQNWINSEKWENSWKHDYSYDSHNKIILSVNFNWSGNTWEEDIKEHYYYDILSDTMTRIQYNWSGNWVEKFKSISVVNEFGYNYLAKYSWDTLNTKWIQSSETIWDYDIKGNLLLRTSRDLNHHYQELIFSGKDDYDYDENGNMIMHIQYYYNYDQKAWIIRYEDHYTNYVSIHSYDVKIVGDSGCQINLPYIYKVLDPEIIECDWIVENGSILSFPDSISVEIIWGEYDSGNLSVLTKNMMGCISDTAIFKANLWPLGTDNTSIGSGVIIYPNPSNGLITIKSLEVDIRIIIIHSANGKEILNKTVNNKIYSIDLSELPSGVYLVSIQTGSGFTRKRLIIL